jgi:DNA-binding NtrC family response regulator
VVEAENRALLDKLDRQQIVDEIVGADAGFRAVMLRLEQVAPTDAPCPPARRDGDGQGGRGAAIHARSRRPDGPMLRVNCGAIPQGSSTRSCSDTSVAASLARSRPARAGSNAPTAARCSSTRSGLPLAAQVRLLRVLQESVIERVGGQAPVAVDVRVVAATHRNLEDMVRAGTFREDLWYRISVFPIELPPLRERREDVPALATHFAWRVGKRIGGAPLTPSPADVERLLNYDWPGNVRELAAVIERAAILGDGKRLDIAGALGVRAASVPPPADLTAQREGRSGAAEAPLLTLDAAIARHIEEVPLPPRREGDGRGPPGCGRVSKASNPHTLRSKMAALGIRWRAFRERGPA